MKQKGMTVLELLISIGIITFLIFIIIVLIRPADRIWQSREVRRVSDMRSIAQSILQYQIDHQGDLPHGIDDRVRMIGTSGKNCAYRCRIFTAVQMKNTQLSNIPNLEDIQTQEQCLDLSTSLQDYINLPYDSLWGSGEQTFYAIRNMNGQLHLYACGESSNLPLPLDANF